MSTHDLATAHWPCHHCGFITTGAELSPGANAPPPCRVCGNLELYVQKDFPHVLGMGILIAACGLSAITYAFYWIAATWIILIGSAVVDGVLYLLMGNVVVCYRCQAQHRGFPIGADLHSFDLAIGEKYRQEKLRRQQLGQP
jgi:hypothetical protein